LEENLELMRTHLAQAEAVGLDTMKEQCGTGNHVDKFFNGVYTLEGQLTNVLAALKEAGDTLACPAIHTLYVSAVHDAVCTDFATANANGFILLLLVSISNMILITLRSSWRHSI
jgi:hypothetical protein